MVVSVTIVVVCRRGSICVVEFNNIHCLLSGSFEHNIVAFQWCSQQELPLPFEPFETIDSCLNLPSGIRLNLTNILEMQYRPWNIQTDDIYLLPVLGDSWTRHGEAVAHTLHHGSLYEGDHLKGTQDKMQGANTDARWRD